MPKSTIRTSRTTRRSRAYFDAYVDHFGLRERITFRDRRRARRARRRRRLAASRSTSGEDAPLRRAAGRQRPPLGPALARAGVPRRRRASRACSCTRTTTRATTRSCSRGKRVVVLGMGNSAMDIAVEATQIAERVFLAARRGAWIVPKYVFGRPLDQIVTAPRIPLAVRQRFTQADAARGGRRHGALRAAEARPPARSRRTRRSRTRSSRGSRTATSRRSRTSRG